MPQGINKNDLGSSSLPILAFLQGVGFPFTGSLIDGESVGSFCALTNRTIASANTDTILKHNLGRKPSGYLVIRQNTTAVIYDGSAASADWTDRTITLRASVAATTLYILVF